MKQLRIFLCNFIVICFILSANSILFAQTAKDTYKSLKKLDIQFQSGIDYKSFKTAYIDAKLESDLFFNKSSIQNKSKLIEHLKRASFAYDAINDIWGKEFSYIEMTNPSTQKELCNTIMYHLIKDRLTEDEINTYGSTFQSLNNPDIKKDNFCDADRTIAQLMINYEYKSKMSRLKVKKLEYEVALSKIKEKWAGKLRLSNDESNQKYQEEKMYRDKLLEVLNEQKDVAEKSIADIKIVNKSFLECSSGIQPTDSLPNKELLCPNLSKFTNVSRKLAIQVLMKEASSELELAYTALTQPAPQLQEQSKTQTKASKKKK